jgi:hypothetical protein
MGLLSVRNASEPSFTSGSIIALLPGRVVAATPLVSSDRARRGEGAGFFSHKRERGVALVRGGGGCCSPRLLFLGEEGEGGNGRRKSGNRCPTGSGLEVLNKICL